MLRLRRPTLAQLFLLVGLLGAFGFAEYYTSLYFAEIAGICVLVLFLSLVLSTRMEKRGLLFAVFLPAFGATAFVLLYSFVFSFRTGAPVLPSILAQRDYAFFFLAPVVYMLSVRGWRLADFERVFIVAAVLTAGDYAVAYLTIDIESWSTSTDFYQQSMVTYDELRGYRLKGPLYIILFVALYFGRRALQSKNLLSFGFRASLVVASVTLIAINMPRSTALSVLVALFLYTAFFARAQGMSRAQRINLSFVLLPVVTSIFILSIPYVMGAFATAYSGDWSYIMRVNSAEKAWDSFLEYPFIGLGQASYQSIPYEQLMGEKFHPSDIGLLGVVFQFGLLGVFLYIFFNVWLIVNLLKLLGAYYGNAKPKEVAFLWTLLTICLGFIVVSPLQAQFFYGGGIGIGAFSWGLLMAHRHGLLRRPDENVSSPRRALLQTNSMVNRERRGLRLR